MANSNLIKIKLSNRYKIGKIGVLILLAFCLLFCVFLIVSLIFKIDIEMSKEGYVACFICFTLFIAIMLYALLYLCYDQAFFNPENGMIVAYNPLKKGKILCVVDDSIYAKVYLKNKKRNECVADIMCNGVLILKIMVRKISYEDDIKEIGINKITVFQ